ncbi:hypothetical protein [Verrucomicrobium sp. BvORR106]|uniref:hypothetical protein n=1 Tax=Verrucomicrobium sp. BvORR106 TaxID=1403819 RepID=UPI000570C29F|nr:hypothetical protein [Verrucomicrobium sp. BvORR106]
MSPKEEAQRLVDSSLPFAEQMLTQHGEFFPFGQVIDVGGNIAHHAGYPGGEQPPSLDVIDVLQRAWRRMAEEGSIRATALTYDIRTTPPGRSEKQDAICIAIDHRDTYSVQVIFPYTMVDGAPDIEPPFAVEGSYSIFGSA